MAKSERAEVPRALAEPWDSPKNLGAPGGLDSLADQMNLKVGVVLCLILQIIIHNSAYEP